MSRRRRGPPSSSRSMVDLNKTFRKRRVDDDWDEDDALSDLCATMGKKLIINPAIFERLLVAERIIMHNPVFIPTIIGVLPECYVRKLATVRKAWRDIAYENLRERYGNRAFSLLWLDQIISPNHFNLETANFDFNQYFHPAWFGDGRKLETSVGKQKDAMMVEGEDRTVELMDCDHLKKPVTGNKPGRPVQFILTYGTSNLEKFIESQGSVNDMRMYPRYAPILYVFSSTVLVTLPDNSGVSGAPNPNLFPKSAGSGMENRLLSSVLFPECSHFQMEPFFVHANLGVERCYYKWQDSTNRLRPKAIILYQFHPMKDNLVMERVRLSLGFGLCDGFPLVTGQYYLMDGKLSSEFEFEASSAQPPLLSGVMITGDENCEVMLLSVNLMGEVENLITNLWKMQRFADMYENHCTCAFLFYHRCVMEPPHGQHFRTIIEEFRRDCPKIRLHGIGGLSGPHCMQCDANYMTAFKNLNEDMERENGKDDFNIVFLLLAYATD